MPTHDYHESLPGFNGDNVYQDGCVECERRAALGLRGLLDIDPHRVHTLWQEMLCSKYRSGDYADAPRVLQGRSELDAQAITALYELAVFLERHTDLQPWRPLSQLGASPLRVAL